ncbi:MAG: ThuA domain-containing protein [Candidatus Sphingomonas phytovorans]|nr:ThuA domain-containing protein [Sphingomonas sp.]WEJ98694.1 MAG: ThuA domain-containing protein [Sphingomonas sp.]
MRYLLRLLAILAGAMTLMGGAAWAKDAPRVLIFSYSTGYRHASIEPGVVALQALGKKMGVTMIASADPAVFSNDGLKDVAAIILLSNTSKHDDPTSEWLTGTRRDAFQAFVHRGGGVVGIHAAADSHYSWPWYGKLFGARFIRHPKGTPEGVVTLADLKHPANKGLAPVSRHADEWYYFDDYDPRMHLLSTVDPASIGEPDANPNPVSWVHEFEGGRVFYTAMGHTVEAYQDPWFLRQVENGVNWVLKRQG